MKNLSYQNLYRLCASFYLILQLIKCYTSSITRKIRSLKHTADTYLQAKFQVSKFLIRQITVNTHTANLGTRAGQRHAVAPGSCPDGPSLGPALVGTVIATFLFRLESSAQGSHSVRATQSQFQISIRTVAYIKTFPRRNSSKQLICYRTPNAKHNSEYMLQNSQQKTVKNGNVNYTGRGRYVKLNKGTCVKACTRNIGTEHRRKRTPFHDPTYTGVKNETLDHVSTLLGCDCVLNVSTARYFKGTTIIHSVRPA